MSKKRRTYVAGMKKKSSTHKPKSQSSPFDLFWKVMAFTGFVTWIRIMANLPKTMGSKTPPNIEPPRDMDF